MNSNKAEKFEEDTQHIREAFIFPEVTRRQIFSPLALLTHQQTTEKAIPNDKTSESSESDA
jgi:hypothetical protein